MVSGFQSMYIFPDEFQAYSLPCSSPEEISEVTDLVCTASTMIDEYCGRSDGDGNGSLVYTTYMERMLAESPGRNFYWAPHRPLVAITAAQVNALSGLDIISGGYYYTGVQPSINTLGNGTLSAIISASGRYIPGRRDNYGFGDEPNSYLNPLNTITLFGGPPPWECIDMVNLDYDPKTGQIWLSSGLYLARYSEIVMVYNSGYDPTNMPQQIKRACAAITKNLMAKGSGTTGMTRFSSSKIGVSAEFNPDVIDGNVHRLLASFMTVRVT
jgi:hypothetical protein